MDLAKQVTVHPYQKNTRSQQEHTTEHGIQSSTVICSHNSQDLHKIFGP